MATDIYQDIWEADQNGNGLRAIRADGPAAPPGQGHVRVARGPAKPDLRILQDVVMPDAKRRTYDLVTSIFDNYYLDEQSHELETEDERAEVHELLEAMIDTPPMIVARQYVEKKTGTAQTWERWYAMLTDLWFRRFSAGGDPALSGFEHVFVGEQEGAKVQGYHFWYKYFLDDGVAHAIDRNRFPGLSSDRIEYVRSEAGAGQEAFPESVTLAYKWWAADYEAKAVRPLIKPKGGFFVGCSVEGLMAIGTVRAHLGARAPKEAVINGARYDLKLFRSQDNQHVRTFYPVFLGAAGHVEGGDEEGEAPRPPVAGGSVRILAALVNPKGHDQGHETVTLLNVEPGTVALEGWALVDKTNKRLGLSQLRLRSGHAVTVELPKGSIELSNKGGSITLVDGQGRVVHTVSYTKGQASREGVTLTF